jgi:alpha-beta hydrolase superfamily lysophospholipase
MKRDSEDSLGWTAATLRVSLLDFSRVVYRPLIETRHSESQSQSFGAACATELNRYRQFYHLQYAELDPAYRIGFVMSDGVKLVCQSWLPERPLATVFVLHGLYDHVGLFSHTIHNLLKQGYAVVAFDQPGHGLSEGEPTEIDDFSLYLDCFQRVLTVCESIPELPKKRHIVAQSTGAAVAMGYLLKKADPFEKIVLLAPLVRPVHWRMTQLRYHLGRLCLKKIARRFGQNSGDPDFIDFVHRRDPLQSSVLAVSWIGSMLRWASEFEGLTALSRPMLIIQGQADEAVDWSYNLAAIRRKFQQVETFMLPAARHHLANEVGHIRIEIDRRLNEFLRAD